MPRTRPDDATIRRPTVPESATVTTYRVTVVDGPDLGSTFDLDGSTSRVLIGKGPACELKLSDPEVSRRHAVLDASDRPLRLTDLGSTNGTFVNGVKVIDAQLFGGES